MCTNHRELGGPIPIRMPPTTLEPRSSGRIPCVREQKTCPASTAQHCLDGSGIFYLSVENATQPALSSQRFTFLTIKPKPHV
jgi:hypothetical protein